MKIKNIEYKESWIDLIFTKYLKGIISYDNITRVETYEYPRTAIREAILNAVAHKDYSAMIPRNRNKRDGAFDC